MRRVNCPPVASWLSKKFLGATAHAHWPAPTSWKETAEAFRTSWDKVLDVLDSGLSDRSRCRAPALGRPLKNGARALWKDESIVPVCGQIAWLIPQPDVTYGVYYRNVNILARR